jgi:hypothetical protein
MATTINASNGSTSGLISTGDASGVLQLQVNNGTPALTLNTTQALGVGTSPSYGTSGQVLTSAGSAASPTWTTPSSGAMTLISTQTASSSALIWTGLSGYSTYLLIFSNCIPTTAGNPAYLSLGYGATPTYVTSGYYYEVNSSSTGAVSTQRFTNGGSIQMNLGLSSSSAVTSYQGGSGFMYITGCNGGYQSMNWNSSCGSTTTTFYTEQGSCQLNSNNIITAIKFTSYTFLASGTASLYGISS